MEAWMKGKRRQHSAELKAKVALAAIRGVSTVQEIAGKYEVHPTLVAKWKREALEGLPGVFSTPARRAPDEAAESGKLYEQIGRLKVENDWLKKKAELVD
jgi:transposase-like protein